MNICVLGGTGFVGTELVTRLALDGHWVRVPTRNPARAQRLRVLDTVELRTANVHHPGTLGQLFDGCDAVINLVGILNPRRGASFHAVHTELPAKVLAAARAAGVGHLLHMSALGAAEHGPSQYLRTKGAAEALLRAAAPGQAAPVAVTIFRPSVIYGAGDSLTNRFARLLRLTAGILPLARAGARFAPIHVHDVVQAFAQALAQRASFGQVYQLCGPEVMTLEEMVRLTAQVAGLACHIVPLPDVLARIQGVVMGALPGKPFSLDNFRSLTIDCVCREDGCARLGIEPRQMSAMLPTYLGSDDLETQFAEFRKTADR